MYKTLGYGAAGLVFGVGASYLLWGRKTPMVHVTSPSGALLPQKGLDPHIAPSTRLRITAAVATTPNLGTHVSKWSPATLSRVEQILNVPADRVSALLEVY